MEMNMQKIVRKLGLVLIATLMISPAAHAMLDVGALISLPMMNASQTGSTNSAKLGMGFGAYGQYTVMDDVTVDFGLHYMMRKFSDTTTSYGLNYLQVPVVARYWIIPMVNVGVGGYYALGMGDLTATPTGGTSVSVPLATAGINSGDFGAIFSVGGKMPVGTFNLVANVNYLMGLRNLTASTVATAPSMKWSGLEFQAGASMEF